MENNRLLRKPPMSSDQTPLYLEL